MLVRAAAQEGMWGIPASVVLHAWSLANVRANTNQSVARSGTVSRPGVISASVGARMERYAHPESVRRAYRAYVRWNGTQSAAIRMASRRRPSMTVSASVVGVTCLPRVNVRRIVGVAMSTRPCAARRDARRELSRTVASALVMVEPLYPTVSVHEVLLGGFIFRISWYLVGSWEYATAERGEKHAQSKMGEYAIVTVVKFRNVSERQE